MSDPANTRRDFLKTSSAVMAGAALSSLETAEAGPVNNPKILNFNPRMAYRPLGNTGFMISEVSLGGHGGSRVEDRIRVLDKAVELGLNYVDNNIADECNLYGEAMVKSKNAGRDRWFIGFASWPEKITPDYEKELTPELMMKNIEARLRSYRTDILDMWRPVGATWGPGQNKIGTLMDVNDKVLDMVVGVFERAKKQGKIRHLGVSAHNPRVFRKVLNKYPQFEVIIFPYLFLTSELGGDSLLALAQQKKVGVIGLKPFGAGTTFGIKPREIQGRVDKRAHILVRQMLQEKRLSAIIPGVNVPEQLEENVRGSYERNAPASPEEKKSFQECVENYYANLTQDYRWLHQWHQV